MPARREFPRRRSGRPFENRQPPALLSRLFPVPHGESRVPDPLAPARRVVQLQAASGQRPGLPSDRTREPGRRRGDTLAEPPLSLARSPPGEFLLEYASLAPIDVNGP